MEGRGNAAAFPTATVPRRMAKKHCVFFLRDITRRTLHRKGIPVVFSSSSGPFLKASDAKGKDAAPVTKNLHRNLTENVLFCEEIQKNFPKAGWPNLPSLGCLSFAIQRPPSVTMAAFSLFCWRGIWLLPGWGNPFWGQRGERRISLLFSPAGGRLPQGWRPRSRNAPEHSQFKTQSVSNHTACRFAEKARFPAQFGDGRSGKGSGVSVPFYLPE